VSPVGPDPSFEAPTVGALGRAGLKGGMATVPLEGGALKLTGRWWMWLIATLVVGLAWLLFVGFYRTAGPRRVS
jgi:hypothetical protein